MNACLEQPTPDPEPEEPNDQWVRYIQHRASSAARKICEHFMENFTGSLNEMTVATLVNMKKTLTPSSLQSRMTPPSNDAMRAAQSELVEARRKKRREQ